MSYFFNKHKPLLEELNSCFAISFSMDGPLIVSAGLYDSSKSRPLACNTAHSIHVAAELIDIKCFAPWVSETHGSEVANFGFNGGGRFWFPRSHDGGGLLALPVRSVK